MKLVFLGPPGAGKGTQADKVCAEVNIPHISTGDLLRQAIKFETPIGLSAKSYIDKGQLVPDSVVIAMVKERLGQADCANGFLLDGFPRTIAQAQALDRILSARAEAVTSVLSIMIPDEMVISRISGRAAVEGRADDADESIIRNRIATYHSQTEPEIAYYREAGKYREVDGVGTIEEVRDRLFDLIDEL